MKVLMAAPYEVKGRYKGGIATVANMIISHSDELNRNGIELIRFETCRVMRNVAKEGKLNFSNLTNSIAIYRELPKKVKEAAPSVLYYHSSIGLALLKDLLAICHVKKMKNVKVIVHIHFAEYKKIMTGIKIVDSLIMNMLNKFVDRIVFLSKETEKEFVSHGIDKKKCSVLYNFSTLEIDENELESKWEKEADITELLFVGSIDKRKGILDVLKCLSEMDEENYRLHICGGFSDEKVKEEVETYRRKMGERLVFHGYVSGEDKKHIFLNSDVLLLPSYGEGLPLVIMEAYHAGCAVVSTNVGAIPEILKRENGYMVEPGNLEQLKSVLHELMTDKEGIKEKQCYNAVEASEYTVERFIEKFSVICRRTAENEKKTEIYM